MEKVIVMSGVNEKHLEFIQAVITRMNANSFQIKAWTVTIVAAFLAIYSSTKNNYFLLVPVVPVITFWLLDSYYLSQERKFRGLYNDVAGVTDNPQEIKPYEMRPDLYKEGKYTFTSSFFSVTILKMYAVMAVLLTVVFVYFEFFTCKGV